MEELSSQLITAVSYLKITPCHTNYDNELYYILDDQNTGNLVALLIRQPMGLVKTLMLIAAILQLVMIVQ